MHRDGDQIEDATASCCEAIPHVQHAADVLTVAHLSLAMSCAIELAKAARLPVPLVTAADMHAHHSNKYGVLHASSLPLLADSWASNITSAPGRLQTLAARWLVCPRA